MNISPATLLLFALLAALPAVAVSPSFIPLSAAPGARRPAVEHLFSPELRRAMYTISAQGQSCPVNVIFFAPQYERDEPAFLSALPGAYFVHWRRGEGELARFPARVRQATVGDALQRWEQFCTFSRGKVTETDRAEMQRRSPGELLPHVWVVEPPIPLHSDAECLKLMLPGLGEWPDGAATRQDLVALTYTLPYYSRQWVSESLTPGRFRLTLHTTHPMEAAELDAALEKEPFSVLTGLAEFEDEAFQPLVRQGVDCWAAEVAVPGAAGEDSPRRTSVRLRLDRAASEASASEFELQGGRHTRGYRSLVFELEVDEACSGSMIFCSSLRLPSVYGRGVTSNIDHVRGVCIARLAEASATPEPEPATPAAPAADLGLLQLPDVYDYVACAYRLSDSSPLPAAQLQLLDEGGNLLATHAVVEGVVQGELPEGARWARLVCGAESLTTEVSWAGHRRRPHPDAPDLDSQWTRAFVLKDRRAYRPGEVVRLCGFIREYRERHLHFPQGVEAELRYELPGADGRMQEKRQAVEVAPDGSFMAEFTLPEELPGVTSVMGHVWMLGRRSATCVNVPIQQNPVPALLLEGGLRLQENELCAEVEVRTADGVPLAGRGLRWELSLNPVDPTPPGWEDYSFGDARPDAPLPDVFDRRSGSLWRLSRGSLDARGRSEAFFTLPEMPFPRRLELKLVADSGYSYTVNGMRHTECLTLSPSSLYVGLRRSSCQSEVGSTLPLSLVLVGAKGECYADEPVEVEVVASLHRLEPGRFGLGIRPAPVGEVVWRRHLMLPAGGCSVEVPLAEAGVYDVVVRGRDARGREFASAIRQYAWSRVAAAPWIAAYEPGFTPVPDKRLYHVGETAHVFLGGEVEGEAFILVQGADSRRFLRCPVKAGARRVAIPLLEEDGPSPELRIALIQGTSLRPACGLPAVQYGSCRLNVAAAARRLCVQLDELPEELPAGGICAVSGCVRDAGGKPVPHCSVFVYAQDVGITSRFTGLSHAEFSVDAEVLGEFSRSSMGVRELPSLPSPAVLYRSKWHQLPGAPLASREAREESPLNSDLWQRVQTDAEGRFLARLNFPSGLADYQVVALASGQLPTQFGADVSSVHVETPLSLRAEAPEYAHVGDVLELPLHLRLAHQPGEIPERTRLRLRVPEASGAECLQGEQVHEVEAGNTLSLRVPLRFSSAGEARIRWQVEAAEGQAGGKFMSAGTTAVLPVLPADGAEEKPRLSRVYERRLPDGRWEPATRFCQGEFVRVTITPGSDCGEGTPTALVEHLPAGWEPVLHEYSDDCTAPWLPQAIRACAEASGWITWEREGTTCATGVLRCTRPRSSGDLSLCYMARVKTCGELVAPPARLEGVGDAPATSAPARVVVAGNESEH